LRKMNLNKWADALSDVQPSQMTASIRSLREKTKFGGIFGEVMEEEIGMALNAISGVGDYTFSKEKADKEGKQWIFDLENQLTTVLSCAIMSGTLNGVEQVSSVAARRKMEKNAKNAEQEALYRFSSDKFVPLREAIDQASPEGMVDVLRDVYMSQEYTVGQKRALAEYAAARLQLQYYNAADAKARRQVNKTQQELLDAQEAGLNAQLPQFFNIARAAQFAEDELLDYDGDFNLVDIIRSSMNRPEEMERILGDLPPREAQLVTNYIYSRARMEGAYQGRSNRAEDYIDDFAYTLEPAVVTDTEGNRTITTALLGDRSVYVLENNGDLAHIMRYDGSKTLVKASELTNITTSSAEEVIDRYRDMYTSEYNAETENAFEHHPKTQAPQVGLQLQSPEGEVVITAVNDNMVEIVPAVYKDGQVQPKEGAEPKTITVDDAYAWQDDYYLSMDADQAYANAMAEANNMSAETTENEGTPVGEIEQGVSEEVTDDQNAATVSQPTETESVAPVAPAAPQTARERVPKDKKGNPIYEQTDADTAWDAIVEETEGDSEMAKRVAADMLEDKKAALAKLQKGKPKKGATVAEKIANEKAHQAAIAQAQNDVSQWEAIVGTEARRREAAMSEADRYAAEMEQKNINEGLKALGEAQSLEEYVLGQLAGGAYKLRWSDKENGTKGFGSHTGLSTEEMKARLSMIDNKNGLTPEEVAHVIVENMDVSFGEVDVMDVTNMVIDAVSTYASRRAMLDGMVNSRAELIRQQERAEQEAEDAWYMEQYHATEEELAAYNEYLEEFAKEIYGEDTDYEQRIATFAEIQLEEYDNQGTDADLRSSADQGEGLASDREGGRSMGETEQLDRREVLADADRVAEAEDGRAGGSVSAQSDDRQSRIDRAVADYRENVDDSPEAIAAAERDQQRYEADMAEAAAETVETLENGDVRRTNRNSRGEVATVAIERDGNIISVDTYEDGVLFEHTDYDANGNATKVTRYKDGEVVSEQEYKDGKRKVTANVFEMAEESQKKRKSKKKKDDTARRSIQESSTEADRVSGEIFGEESLGEGEPVSSRGDGGILEEGAGKKKRTAKARRQSDNRQEARDGKAERLSRGISPVQQQAIDEYTRANPWDANFTDDERGVLNMYRMATINELDELAHKLADKINSGKATPRDRMRYDVLAAYAKSGELKAVADAMGVEYDSPVSLDTIKDLFEKFNSDPELAVLFNRVFPLVKEINPTIVYRRFTKNDLNEGEDVSPDDILGQYSLQDNLIEYNRNQIDSNHCTEQEKASTIVHEMIHAVARYAIRVQEAHNEGVELDIQLPKRLLDAAQSLIEVYDAIKDNEIFNDDRYESGKMYGVSSVHEMLSELADPEFREKLKQVSIENLPSDKKGRVRDALKAIKDFLHRMLGWDSSSAYARTKRALDKLIDNYDSAGYNKARELADDDFAQQIRPSSEENLRFRDGAPFFSNAERAVENIKQNKATPEQWLAMIKKDGGLKAGEDKWMGLSDWLEEKKAEGVKTLTKDEVLQFIRENQIEIEEVEYSENPAGFDELKEEYEAMLRDEGYDAAHDAMVERFGDDFDIAFDDLGGELVVANEEAAAALLGSENIINPTRLEYTTEGLDNKQEIALVVSTIEPWNQSDTIHFGDAGDGRAVAWIRFGETTDTDGNRVLVIDEVQSKRHDEGRAKGYSKHTKREEFRRLVDEMYDKYGANFHVKMTRDEEIEFDRLTNERIREDENNNSAVPDAPFDKNYHELVMKRMLRYAAENSFDKVAWTKGVQQAQRYGLNKVVDTIDASNFGSDTERDVRLTYTNEQQDNLLVRMSDGVVVKGDVDGSSVEGQKLSDIIGKDAADKLLSTTDDMEIEGEDLSIGGEDRVALYDEMIPRFMNKYTKKWGTKVGEVTLPNVEEAGRTMWSVDVTDSMRESVMQGQPMFREGMGAISDREVSYENDPIAKFQGKPRYYGKRAAAFAERERRRMENAAREASEMLGLEVEIITDASTLNGRKAKAKGWYDINSKKVVVVIPNHVSKGDAVRTVLHEGVAHHGLRELFGDGFDAMLDNIYNNVAPELKARIDAIAERMGVSTSVATEEYLASLAETTNFEEAQERGWWSKIKQYFVKMLDKLAMPGLKLEDELTDNELRYILWRSYKNLVEPNSYLKPLGYAEDVVKQKELKVVEYAEKAPATPMAADASEAEEWAAVTMQRIEELEAKAAQLENEIAEMEADRDADDESRYDMWEEQLDVLRKQSQEIYDELEGLYSLEVEDEDIEDYEAEREAEKQRFNKETDDIRYRFIGEKGAENLDRAEEATTRLDNLKVAREMEAAEKDAKTIKMATGWERGADGKWRYEVEDIEIEAKFIKEGERLSLPAILKTNKSSDELFLAYPKMVNYKVWYDYFSGDYAGLFEPSDNRIRLNGRYLRKDNKAIRSTLIHEIQHAIQQIEGFADGASWEDFSALELRRRGFHLYESYAYEERGAEILHALSSIRLYAENLIKDGKYKYLGSALRNAAETYVSKGFLSNTFLDFFGTDIGSIVSEAKGATSSELYEMANILLRNEKEKSLYRSEAGEVEARNASRRMNMSIERRRKSLASETEDVAREDQIFLREAEKSAMAAEDGMLFSSQELAKMETPIYKSKGGFKNLAEAEVWAKENLQGQTRTNQFTGDEISIGKKSVSEMLNEKTLNQSVDVNTHLAALQSVLDFIETGIPAEVHKDTHGRGFDVMRLYNAIEVDGKVYRVKSTVRKVRQGDRYYTYEVQKMELIEERGANPNREGENPRNGNNSTNSISGAKLLKGVKKTNSDEEILPSDEDIRNDAEIISEVERESANLGVQVRIARSIDELPDDAETRKRAEDGSLKGVYSTRDGEVVVYLPNTENANDAKRTILHEIVGHKGLRSLIGEQQYDKAMLQLMYMLPADVRDAVLRRAERHGWNAAIAMDEYLAEQAERDVQPTWWGKVNAKIRALLRNMGFDVKLTDADVTYLLWRSRKKLQGDDLNDMAVNTILKQAARKSAEADAWNEQAFKDAEMRDFERNTLPSVRHRMGADVNDYEKAVRTLGFKQAEAWQDSTRSLLVFQQALAKASGKDISDFENAYMYENRMSSANLMEMEQYKHMVYNPLLKAIHELEQMGASRESIINYLFAKSGLERNEVFARRDAKKNAEGDASKEQQLYDKYRQKDYAGLTALTRGDAQIAALVDDHSKKKTEYERLEQNKKRGVAVSDADLKAAKKKMNDARKAMITAIEAEAQRMVDEFEAQHNTDNLWDKIRNCTRTTLNISHDAGVMSDEVYNELWNQFQYYIPLRGFAEITAEDVYLYLGGNDSPYNAPIKTAYGRTSLADDPIATIGNMAESAIVEANRNRLKQRFLYMVERHNTDLASISDVWLEYDEKNNEWNAVFARIPDDATPSEAKRQQQEFEDKMKMLAEQNPGKYANAKQQPNIPYRVVKKGDRQEHHIIVKRNGKDVVITINGNPRVAQAINGLTNPEQNQGMISRMASWINRNLSANFTMRNPAFMVSNFVRDGFYTNSMVWVKENPAYARQYNKNWAICTAQIAGLVSRYKRYEKGDKSALDMSNDMHRMFYEFMINGGETGYTVIKSVEDYKGLISGEMKKMEAGAMGTARRVADTVGNVVGTFGRWAEDTSRFAAYMTSRQMGRTITKSIWDAKEISVNFNKKGSGNRMSGKFERGNRVNYILSSRSRVRVAAESQEKRNLKVSLFCYLTTNTAFTVLAPS